MVPFSVKLDTKIENKKCDTYYMIKYGKFLLYYLSAKHHDNVTNNSMILARQP